MGSGEVSDAVKVKSGIWMDWPFILALTRILKSPISVGRNFNRHSGDPTFLFDSWLYDATISKPWYQYKGMENTFPRGSVIVATTSAYVGSNSFSEILNFFKLMLDKKNN